MTSGGFKAFEHYEAMAQAFKLHREIGKEKIQERIYGLNAQLKEKLSKMDHIIIYTSLMLIFPSGIAVFDVDSMSLE